jgi:D-glycerate 3-kinase
LSAARSVAAPVSVIWPEAHRPLPAAELDALQKRIAPDFARLLQELQLPEHLQPLLQELYLPLSAWLAGQCPAERPLAVGLNGAQGSGKSTLCRLLAYVLDAGFGLKSCVLSIDDLYLTRAERRQLANDIHPLLATRGVPGTHDVALGQQLFDRLRAATATSATALPRFDKARDDRLAEPEWPGFRGRPDLILFEGWCVGATPQPPRDLRQPVNVLEEQEDAAGRWRQYVNRQLSGAYRELFARLDLLLMLQIPDWSLVYRWRRRQERQLIAGNPDAPRTMDDRALRRFIMHYERLTRHQLQELPKRADLLLQLNPAQQIDRIRLT